jgi:hypothetical protein
MGSGMRQKSWLFNSEPLTALIIIQLEGFLRYNREDLRGRTPISRAFQKVVAVSPVGLFGF